MFFLNQKYEKNTLKLCFMYFLKGCFVNSLNFKYVFVVFIDFSIKFTNKYQILLIGIFSLYIVF